MSRAAVAFHGWRLQEEGFPPPASACPRYAANLVLAFTLSAPVTPVTVSPPPPIPNVTVNVPAIDIVIGAGSVGCPVLGLPPANLSTGDVRLTVPAQANVQTATLNLSTGVLTLSNPSFTITGVGLHLLGLNADFNLPNITIPLPNINIPLN